MKIENLINREFRLRIKIIVRKSVQFLKDKIELKTFILLASLFVGIISGLTVVLLKNIVHLIQDGPKELTGNSWVKYFLILTPLAGIILSVLITNFLFNGKILRSLGKLIYIIIRKGSDIPRQEIASPFLTSGVTVGMGGSAGLEAPSVIIGAAVGSNIAKGLNFDYKTRTLLLACGSAAGISGIFNSPIAGVIFALEVLMPEFSVPSIIPLLLASASSAVVAKLLYSGQIFYLVTEGWQLTAIPFYILLGIMSGLISLYIIKMNFWIEKKLKSVKKQYSRAIIGGVILSLFIFIVPPLYGEGYGTVVNMLAGNYGSIMPHTWLMNYFNKDLLLVIFAFVIIITKSIATPLTLESGGSGGVIAPSLFTGAVTGFFVAHLVGFLGIAQLNHPNFIVVGMAGILSGVLHSPLTGIFLIAEVTGGYKLIVPLMIVTALSFFISRHFHEHSIYTTPLAKQGIKFRSERERYFIQQLSVSDIVEKDFVKIHPNMTLRELVDKILHTKRNLFPVVDENKKLIGIVTLDDVREVMLNADVYDIVLAYEVMNPNFDSVELSTDVNSVLEIFEEKQIWNLAVTNNGEYVGFISKSNLFNRYISVWAKQQSEGI